LQRNAGEGARATNDIAGETPALQQRGLQLAEVLSFRTSRKGRESET